MPKVLTYIEYGLFAVSVICVFFIMFMVGDTDILSEPPTWVTTVLTAVGCLSAVVGAIIHWAGIPMKESAKAAPKPSADGAKKD